MRNTVSLSSLRAMALHMGTNDDSSVMYTILGLMVPVGWCRAGRSVLLLSVTGQHEIVVRFHRDIIKITTNDFDHRKNIGTLDRFQDLTHRWMELSLSWRTKFQILVTNLVENLTGRHVLISGTDTGFGRKLALDLARSGFVVHAGCYTQIGIDELQKEASTTRLKTFLLDVTDQDSVNAARKIVQDQLPPGQGLWGLVNNAGIARGIVFEFASFKDYEVTMAVNFYGQIRMTNTFLPLIQKARGRIVNVVSIIGRFSLAAGPYSCSKFAAQAYSDGLRRQMSPLGVKVSIIEPGFYPTAITSTKNLSADIDQSWAALPDDVRRGYGQEYFTKLKEMFEKRSTSYPLASGNKLNQVTDSIRHAICSQHPKARYVCGLDAALLYRPAANIVPDWLVDYGIALFKNIN